MAFHDTINNIPYGGELKSAEINGILNAIHENTLELKNGNNTLTENVGNLVNDFEQNITRNIAALQDGLSDHERITGNENLHGHIKLTDDIESTARATESVGVSPFVLAQLRAELTEKMYSTLDFPAHALIRAVSTEDGDGGVSGIPFSVSVNQEPEMIYTTKADGEVKAAGLGGDRLLIKPAEGIMWTATPEYVEVSLAAEDTVEVEFALEPIPMGIVKIIAESSSGTRLSGRTFTVTVSGEAAKTLTTNANGEIAITTDPDKTVTAVLKDLGLGASVNQNSSVTTVIGGAITPTVFTLTPEIGKVLTYTSSATITLDPVIKIVDIYASGAGGGGGGWVSTGSGGSGGVGGNGVATTIIGYRLTIKTLKITVGAQGTGGVGSTLTAAPVIYTEGNLTYRIGASGKSGGATSVAADTTTIVSCPGGGGGQGGGQKEYTTSGARDGHTGAAGSPNGNGRSGGGVTHSSPYSGNNGLSGEVKITIKEAA